MSFSFYLRNNNYRKKMVKITQEDISKSKRELKKVLKHEDEEIVCDENKCFKIKRKIPRLEEEDK